MKMLLACLLLISAASGSVLADDSLKNELKTQYEKQILVLRTPFQAGDQEFDSDGKPLKDPPANEWKAYGPLLIKKTRIASRRLELEGVRVDSSDLYKPDKKHLLDSGHTIKVKIHLDKPLDSAGEVRAILNRVFFPDVKNSEHPLPEYCRADANVTKDNIFRVGNGVSSPIPVYSPDPDYSEKARQHKYEGTTILAVVVDESGRVACIKIEKPLRMGLNCGGSVQLVLS